MSHSDQLVLQTAGVNDVWHYNEIHLDSQARDSGTNDEPVFTLPTPLHDVLGFKVLSAQIPFSYYLIHDHNNTCNFYFYQGQNPQNGQGIVIPYTLTLPVGNYQSPTDLASAWETAMNDAAAAVSVPVNYRFAVTFHPEVGRLEVYPKTINTGLRITVANNTSSIDFRGISFLFPTDSNGESCASLFGCQPNTFYGTIFDGASPSPTDKNNMAYQVYSGIVNLTGSNYLQLFSNLGNRLSNNFLVNGATTSSPPIIARIPVNVEPYEVIDYRDANPSFFFDTSLSQIQTIQLSLRLGRAENHTLQLNDQPWSVVIMVLTQRETTAGRHVYPSDGGNKRIRVR